VEFVVEEVGGLLVEVGVERGRVEVHRVQHDEAELRDGWPQAEGAFGGRFVESEAHFPVHSPECLFESGDPFRVDVACVADVVVAGDSYGSLFPSLVFAQNLDLARRHVRDLLRRLLHAAEHSVPVPPAPRGKLVVSDPLASEQVSQDHYVRRVRVPAHGSHHVRQVEIIPPQIQLFPVFLEYPVPILLSHQ